MKSLSREDIENIAARVLKAYKKLPETQGGICRIDPEILLKKVLGLNIEYLHLSPDSSVLGITSFEEVEVQIYDESDTDTFFFLDGKTVLVEKELCNDSSKRGRLNFTVMHEGSHQIYKMLYPRDYGVKSPPKKLHFYKGGTEYSRPITDWEEWQANALASALLMPRELIARGMYIFNMGDKIKCLNRIYKHKTYEKFAYLAELLGVSKQALAIRMKQLGLLESDYLSNPDSMLEICGEKKYG